MPTFGERLRLLRNNKELSQQDFAKQIGLSKSSVNMYERNDREPNLETLEKIADYFNVDLDYLLGKSDFPNKYAWLASVSEAPEEPKVPANANLIRIAARDGSYQERRLSDQQLAALIAILDQMPDVPDDL